MASSTRKAARSGSTARERTAQQRTPPKLRGGETFDEQLKIVLEHRQRIDAEYVQLQQQRQQIDGRMEELKLLAHQVLGREQQLRELREEAPPLPPVALMQAEGAEAPQNGAAAASGAEGESAGE